MVGLNSFFFVMFILGFIFFKMIGLVIVLLNWLDKIGIVFFFIVFLIDCFKFFVCFLLIKGLIIVLGFIGLLIFSDDIFVL